MSARDRFALAVGYLALLAAPPAAIRAQQAFTLEQVLSAPFPEGMVAAPAGGGGGGGGGGGSGGGAVAWVFNAKGVRNIWVAQAPDYRGRAMTQYADDDGQEIADLTWTPDGRRLVYVRGGDANSRGEYPNPLSLVAGVEQALWVVPLDSGAPRRLAEGNSPAVSPKGDRVAFLRRGQIWWVPLDSGQAEQLVRARGNAGALRWSPDGSKLAFVSNRGDHGFIGVYDVEAKSLRFLDPSPDRDNQPVWSPDGRSVAFIRTPASERQIPFTPRREGPPWSVRIADAATGAGREVWRADPGPGSAFRGVVAPNQLMWAGERLVFPWEKDGMTHLYAVHSQGGRAELLTPGPFEVEHVTQTPAGDIVYASNQGDIDRRHLWRVSPAGGRPVALTSGTGIEWAPVAAGDGRAIAFFRSDARKPPRPAILIGTGPARDLAPQAIPADFPEAALVEPQAVLVTASDGMLIHTQLFVPRNLRPGERRPAVVFFHGGSRRQMLLGWHYMYYYRNSYALNQYLASKGYVVLSVNYRSGIGYGMEFREAINYGAQGASEYRDVVGAGLYLRSRSDVDPARIGLWGGSYGGYLTALGLARASDLFAAGVDFHGVHNWVTEVPVWEGWETLREKTAREEAMRVAFQASPMADVDSWRSPVLLIHGDDDRNVQFGETVQLAAALRARGVQVEQLIYPDEVHDFLTHAHWLQAYRAAADFFDRRIGPNAPRPSTAGSGAPGAGAPRPRQ